MRGKIDRSILALALPAIVNNVTVPLLGLCDTAIAGHLGDAASIGAVSVGAMMMNVVYWLCGFLRAGTSGLAAQAFGANCLNTLFSVLRKAIAIAACIAAAVIVLQHPLLELFLLIIRPEPLTASLASVYFTIGVWAAPAHLWVMAFSGWFIGRQDTVTPMVVSIGMNVLNIALSVTFVFALGLGFAGIAWGTLIASWAGAAALWLCVRNVKRKTPQFAAGGRDAVLKLGRFFSVSADLFMRSACIMGVSMALTSVSARLGNVSLAANAVLTQFFLFFSYFMDGFAFAGEALVGKAVGAGDSGLFRNSVRGLVRAGILMAVVFTLVYAFLGSAIVSLLTNDAEVREAVDGMRLWMTALPAITVMAFIFDGIYIGWARTRPLFLTTLAAASIFFAVTFLPDIGISMPLLWTAFEIYLFLRGALLILLYRKYQMNLLIL